MMDRRLRLAGLMAAYAVGMVIGVVAFFAAMAGLAWLLTPPVLGLVAVGGALLFFAYMMASLSLEKREREEARVAERLSRED
jgi:amino acid transporter